MKSKSSNKLKTRIPHYGDELKGLMRANRVKQSDIAKIAHTARQAVTSKLATPNPKIATIRQICALCGVDMAEFITRVEREASK